MALAERIIHGRVFDLTNKEDKASKAYIERYLDVTKSDMLFAKKVVLVEGISEQLLLPVFAKYLKSDLVDDHVAIINIGGRYFTHFLKLFDKDKSLFAIDKQVAVITDIDPVRKEKDVKGASYNSCYPFELNADSDNYEYWVSSNSVIDTYSDRGKNISVFTQPKNTGCTFEYELLIYNSRCKDLIVSNITNGDVLTKIMTEYAKDFEELVSYVGDSKKCKRIKNGLKDKKDKDQLIAALYLNFVSKAESAQEIAGVLSEKESEYHENKFSFKIPPYIEEAIKWIQK